MEKSPKLSAFNLKEEKEEGHFDENGCFIWKEEEKVVQEDAWLQNVSSEEMQKAKRAKMMEEEEEDIFNDFEGYNAKAVLYNTLMEGEVVLKCLKRLGGKSEEFNTITEAANGLMVNGDYNVYDKCKNEFVPVELHWKYKDQQEVVHGPFTHAQIVQWRQMGYFQGEPSVEFQAVDLDTKVHVVEGVKDSKSWIHAKNILFESLKYTLRD